MLSGGGTEKSVAVSGTHCTESNKYIDPQLTLYAVFRDLPKHSLTVGFGTLYKYSVQVLCTGTLYSKYITKITLYANLTR